MDLGQFGQFGTEFLYSAIIAVIFAGAGRLWSLTTHRRGGATAGLQMGQVMGGLPGPQPAPQPIARRRVNYGRVLLHVGVFQFIVNIVAFVIGFLLGTLLYLAGQSTESQGSIVLFNLVILVLGTLGLIIGFLIIGLRVERSVRWLHMTYVALGVAASTLLINWLTGAFDPSNPTARIAAPIVALVQTFVGMGIGGGLSFLIGGRQDSPPAPMSQPYPYGAPPSVPLYPGQAAGPSRPLYPPPSGPQPYPPPYSAPYPPQQPSPYPPQQGQQGAPYYPPNPGAPQYPPQGAPPYPPQYPPAGAPQPYPPNAGQPPRYPPQYPPPQQPPAGGQGAEGQ
jgi:hypothetical protein